jgi:hypothetical protein
MEGVKNWEKLTWQERREERFKRWLSPKNVKFKNQEAEKKYKTRVTRFIKAIKMEEPDRVPCSLPIGYFPAAYIGVNFHTIMYDYKELRRAWLTFMRDFPDMDEFSGPGLVMPGRILDAIDNKTQKWPGHGLPVDSWYYQFVEGEYMKADEYDMLMKDPTGYSLRVQIPRTAGLFKPFERMMGMGGMGMGGGGMGWVAMMTDPEMRKVFETLMSLADDYSEWRKTVSEISQIVLSEGFPNIRGGGMTIAPFDALADGLRGTHGTVMDMFRRPEKILEYIEYITPQLIEMSIRMANHSDCPLVAMPLHKGDDTFMSDAQFEKFYWPSYKKLLLAQINEGLVPYPFAEGAYNLRLKYIADMPRSGVVWYFDKTDMKEAKKILGNTSCIVGNVPTSVMITGTTKQVKEYCRKLIEDCAPGGGYILTGGASVDNGNADNLRAMQESVEEYGYYK